MVAWRSFAPTRRVVCECCHFSHFPEAKKSEKKKYLFSLKIENFFNDVSLVLVAS